MQSVIGRPAMRRACSLSPTEARRYVCAPVQHATCRESGSQSRTKAHSVAVPPYAVGSAARCSLRWRVVHGKGPVARLRRRRRCNGLLLHAACRMWHRGRLARCRLPAAQRAVRCDRFASMRARNAAKSADCSWDRLSSDGRRFEVATWRISALVQHATATSVSHAHVA